jgi:hypothetical protein
MVVRATDPAELYFTIAQYELAALTHYLEVLEAEILGAPEEQRLRIRFGGSVPELHEAIVRSMLPGNLRGAFVVAVWAVYESTLLEVADVLHDKLRPDAPQLNPGRLILGTVDRYYRDHFGFGGFGSEQERNELHFILRLRNAFAHGNGRRGAISPRNWSSIVQDSRRFGGITLDRNFVEIDAPRARQVLGRLQESIEALIQRARAALTNAGIKH